MDPDAQHPLYPLLYDHCAAHPNAQEDHPWGDTVFKIRGKLFACLSAPARAAVTLKPAPEDLDGLLALPFVARAAYVGRYGWVTVTVEDEAALDLARQLISRSYELVARGRAARRAAGAG